MQIDWVGIVWQSLGGAANALWGMVAANPWPWLLMLGVVLLTLAVRALRGRI